ncbi:hypothetical protein ABEB36_009866 [Hypothenemus hampei]|uniref:Uncharacterized protein n=1 Tax=Hypothenemus hampei TaxID=57062 RepID=A0ABD1EJV9_HYPHA
MKNVWKPSSKNTTTTREYLLKIKCVLKLVTAPKVTMSKLSLNLPPYHLALQWQRTDGGGGGGGGFLPAPL